jgi:hypothetical protein
MPTMPNNNERSSDHSSDETERIRSANNEKNCESCIAYELFVYAGEVRSEVCGDPRSGLDVLERNASACRFHRPKNQANIPEIVLHPPKLGPYRVREEFTRVVQLHKGFPQKIQEHRVISGSAVDRVVLSAFALAIVKTRIRMAIAEKISGQLAIGFVVSAPSPFQPLVFKFELVTYDKKGGGEIPYNVR